MVEDLYVYNLLLNLLNTKSVLFEILLLRQFSNLNGLVVVQCHESNAQVGI